MIWPSPYPPIGHSQKLGFSQCNADINKLTVQLSAKVVREAMHLQKQCQIAHSFA